MRVFSGVQPTGDLHLGNYLGAIKQFVEMQNKAECLFCVVDMHAITVKHDPKQLEEDSLLIAAAYIASGIDPMKATIFIQSEVTAHAELSWILSSVARMGWLERMTQFREKTGTVPPENLRDVLKRVKGHIDGSAVRQGIDPRSQMAIESLDVLTLYDALAGATSNVEKASVGLFTYPVLMAADILAYKSTHVPVGADQKQHLNLARDIAQKFNNDYAGKEFFPIPEAVHGSAPRIMSLQDGTRKMSKSDPDIRSRITFADTDDEIAKKIRRATADTLPFPSSEEEVLKPEIENLITIYTATTAVSRETVFREFGGQGYGTFKPALVDAVVALVSPVRDKMSHLMTDRTYLNQILDSGAQQADEIAAPVLAEAKKLIGFRSRRRG